MDKEEILAKSRKENIDEDVIITENQERKIGESIFCLVFIFITLFNFFNGQSNEIAMAMFFTFITGELYSKYHFTKNKVFFISYIAGLIVTILSLITFVLKILR